MNIIFDDISKNNKWNNEESVSGDGSSIKVNKYRVKFLDNFIKKNGITDVYDICGDCNWQHTIPSLSKINYFGFDISNNSLELAKKKNKNRKYMKFSKNPIDLTNYVFKNVKNPNKTLIIIKEVIQHLNLKNGMKLLNNIKNSKIKYIAITNHDKELFNVKQNINIKNGDFYPNNLFMDPFNFKNPISDISNNLSVDKQKKYGNLMIFNIQGQDFKKQIEHFMNIKTKNNKQLIIIVLIILIIIIYIKF